jgi:hypothetical protein
MKIDDLTLAQEDALRRFHADWYRYGTSTDRADRPATERAISRMYEIVGKPAPQFLWTDSPATGALAVALLSGKLGNRPAAGAAMNPLGDSLWDSLRDSLWDSLRDSLGDSLGDSLRGSLRDSLRGIINNDAFWGQHEAYWIAFYLFPQEQGLVTYDPKRSEQLGLWATISRSAGWWFPYDGVVVVTERPTKVVQETVTSSWPYGVNSRRLHSADGAALEYADGWKVFSWHGIRVPEWVITEPTTDRALKEPNSEIRRAAFESIGWDKAIADMKLTPIATSADPGNAPHELRLYKLPNQIYDEPVNLLVMTNGSPDRDGNQRVYAETVPAEIKDPISAAAWQYDVDPKVYAQLVRRT